jgi:hypothetical protein
MALQGFRAAIFNSIRWNGKFLCFSTNRIHYQPKAKLSATVILFY